MNNENTSIRILKIATCPSLSGRSTLTYQVGCEGEDIFLRVYANSARGFFGKEWISFIDINKELEKLPDDTPVTSTSFHALFEGKSVNTAGFLMAVLKAEELLEHMKGKRRYYQRADSDEFIDEVKKLMASKVSLNSDDKPSLPTKPGRKTIQKGNTKKT